MPMLRDWNAEPVQPGAAQAPQVPLGPDTDRTRLTRVSPLNIEVG